MAKLFEATGELASSGLHPSLPNSEVPLWKDGDNVVFTEQSVRPGPGQSPLFNFAEGGRGLGLIQHEIEHATSTIKYVFWGTPTKLWMGIDPSIAAGSPTPVDVTYASGPYTGTEDDLWSFAAFGNFVLATNGVDPPQILIPSGEPNSAVFVDLTTISDLDSAFRAKLVAVSGPFILFFNTNNSDQEARWSDEDDHTVWTPATDNFSRDLVVRDIQSDIRAVVPLGSGLALYGRDNVEWIRFTGPPFIFETQSLLSGIGVVGKHAITTVGRRHFGFSQRGLFVSDGSGFEFIDKPSIHDEIFMPGKLDEDLANRSVVWSSQKEQMVLFSYPLEGGGGATVGFNYRRNVWSKFSYYRTAAVGDVLFGSPLVLDTDGTVLSQGIEGSFGESAPVVLTPSGTMNVGYGQGGYGSTRYGGAYPTIES